MSSRHPAIVPVVTSEPEAIDVAVGRNGVVTADGFVVGYPEVRDVVEQDERGIDQTIDRGVVNVETIPPRRLAGPDGVEAAYLMKTLRMVTLSASTAKHPSTMTFVWEGALLGEL